ncbi:MAG: GNAT family N-acetyltransferase [Phycisphaerales bacterium]|nr:GNAT family N-acetyltransferase [Phycisphaerales bacterium]
MLHISTDPSLLDLNAIHGFLSTCYWSPGIARGRLERAIAHSLCFGVYDTGEPRASDSTKPAQIGFARVVTDQATYAYLCDVFVLESHRGRGASKLLMRAIIEHPDLQGLRRFCLMTRDAHGLYSQFGFAPCADPTRYMERLDRESYKRP